MDDNEVAKLKSDIFKDRYAADAAKRLLIEADVFIQSGEPLPEALRFIIGDCLEHLADTSPLTAFRWLRPESVKPHRKAADTDREWLEIAQQIRRAHEIDGLPLYGNGASNLAGSAFEAVAALRKSGNDEGIAKEARRLKERWETHKKKFGGTRVSRDLT